MPQEASSVLREELAIALNELADIRIDFSDYDVSDIERDLDRVESLARDDTDDGVEWADKHFYLPEGSSHIAGHWTTQPVQVVMLNMMTNDAIKIVSVRKSARLGYTKILVAALLYFAEHKNVVPWSISLSMTNRMDLSPTRLTPLSPKCR